MTSLHYIWLIIEGQSVLSSPTPIKTCINTMYLHNTTVINFSTSMRDSEWPTCWYWHISTSLMALRFRPLRFASLIPWYRVDKTKAWKVHQVLYRDMWRTTTRYVLAQQANHLRQQIFMLWIQPSDKNIRGLQMVHHVSWFEVVRLGEVVSPCNSNPNCLICVLHYFDRHLEYNIIQWLSSNIISKCM